jgi:hypothetical protein
LVVTLRLVQDGPPEDLVALQVIVMLPAVTVGVRKAHPVMVTVCALTPAEPNIEVASSAAPHNNPRKADFMCFSQMNSNNRTTGRAIRSISPKLVAARASYATFKPADTNMLLA